MVSKRIGWALLIGMWLLAGCWSGGGGFSFVHTTDTHVTATQREGSTGANVAAMYHEISGLQPRPAFVLNTGDFVESGAAAESESHQKILANLTLPHYGTPGNHDVRWNPLGKEGYERSIGPLCQSWDFGGVHFVTLDSTVLLSHLGHVDPHQLDWLARDLEQAGGRPVVIGMHHPIGSERRELDNEKAILDAVEGYNVCLWLFGHGHGNLLWNINGVPAIEARGLYQGSYHVIEVDNDRIRVMRRSGAATQPAAAATEVATASIRPKRSPARLIQNRTTGQSHEIVVKLLEDLAVAKAEMRVDGGKYVAMNQTHEGYVGSVAFESLIPGDHLATIRLRLADGRAYLNTVAMPIERSDGSGRTWRTDLRSAVQSRLVRDGDAVYTTTMGGELAAMKAADGQVKWKVKTAGAVFSTPCVSDGTVYFGSADHFVYAVDAATGQIQWRTQTGGGVFAGPAAAKGIVCAPSVDLMIYGMDARTGAVQWKAACGGMVQSTVATDAERFFVGGWDNTLRCLDASTGRQLWAKKFGRSMYYSPAIASPAVGGGKVFVTSNDGVLHAVNIASGEVAWEFDGKRVGYSGPLYHEGRIYLAIGDGGRVYCFEAESGQTVWESSAGSVIYDSSFAFGGGNVFIGAVNGTVSAFAAKNGVLQWQYSLGPGHLLASPAADERRVYIGSMNGRVTALPVAAPQR
ncbi:MAG: PQQ-binding-like beta-propeller repeat protein [Planctomycetota bacterium]|nr:PQQ-binding-like beta-propeller repeat protein [Planctomycetota bacterium]